MTQEIDIPDICFWHTITDISQFKNVIERAEIERTEPYSSHTLEQAICMLITTGKVSFIRTFLDFMQRQNFRLTWLYCFHALFDTSTLIHIETVSLIYSYLYEFGAPINRSLYCACQQGHVPGAKLLLQQYSADALVPIEKKMSALDIAVQYGHLQIVKEVLNHLKLSRLDPALINAMQLSCIYGRLHILKYLLGTIRVPILDETPLYLAITRVGGSYVDVEITMQNAPPYQQYHNIIRYLLTDPHITEGIRYCKRKSFLMAVSFELVQYIEYMIKDINQEDFDKALKISRLRNGSMYCKLKMYSSYFEPDDFDVVQK